MLKSSTNFQEKGWDFMECMRVCEYCELLGKGKFCIKVCKNCVYLGENISKYYPGNVHVKDNYHCELINKFVRRRITALHCGCPYFEMKPELKDLEAEDRCVHDIDKTGIQLGAWVSEYINAGIITTCSVWGEKNCYCQIRCKDFYIHWTHKDSPYGWSRSIAENVEGFIEGVTHLATVYDWGEWHRDKKPLKWIVEADMEEMERKIKVYIDENIITEKIKSGTLDGLDIFDVFDVLEVISRT